MTALDLFGNCVVEQVYSCEGLIPAVPGNACVGVVDWL